MYLTSTNLLHYLLARGFVTRQAVVHSPFSVYEIDGRHRSFRVNGGAGAGLFVKQLKTTDEPSIDSIHREASCYRLAWSNPAFAPWQRLVPRFAGYDPQRHVLIVERVANAEDMVQCHRRLQRFPLDLAHRIGAALADFHNTARSLRPSADDVPFQVRQPWIFRFHDEGREDTSPAVKELVNEILSEGKCSGKLASLGTDWSPELLIHGDFKWSNCLVAATQDDLPRIYLVDWELANLGDPLWDVAGALAGYLVDPMLKSNVYGARQPATLENAEFVSLVQPAMRVLWRAYCDGVELPAAELEDCAMRCACFLGARLLATTIEYHQDAPALGAIFRPVTAAARTLLVDPRPTAALLYGGATS